MFRILWESKLHLCDGHSAILGLLSKYHQITHPLATGQSQCTLDRLEFRNCLHADLRIPGPVPSPECGLLCIQLDNSEMRVSPVIRRKQPNTETGYTTAPLPVIRRLSLPSDCSILGGDAV
jgi:hypothetical protein